MLPALFLTLAALAFTLFRLWACRAQLLDMARTLEETPAVSSLRLTVRLESSAVRRLCCAVNRRLDEGRDLRLETLRGEQELRYTMACISHDIRPPLAGAMGYLQLLEAEPEHREYLGIVLKRLDELFLYTRLQSETAPLECRETAALPPLWDALADLCPQLEAAGITPDLRFDREDMTVWGDAAALGRVYRNLSVNALRHGGGDGVICFSNPLGPGPRPDPEHLFDRFYQGSPARGKGEPVWASPLCGS